MSRPDKNQRSVLRSATNSHATRRCSLRWTRCGNTLIETAPALQLLSFMAMGMVEFGQYFFIKHCFEGAARDGARAAILAGSQSSDVTSAVTNALKDANITYNANWVTLTDISTNPDTVYPLSSLSSFPSGDLLQLKVSTTYDTIPNVIRPLILITGGKWGIKNGKAISGQCTMVKE